MQDGVIFSESIARNIAVDDVAGMVPCSLHLHQAPFAILAIQVEGRPDKYRSGDDSQCDTYPLVHACHIQHHKGYEDGEQTAGEDEEVLAA